MVGPDGHPLAIVYPHRTLRHSNRVDRLPEPNYCLLRDDHRYAPHLACRTECAHRRRYSAYLVPGDPVANMYGSMYGGQSIYQALSFLQDLKLGQYVKLAPRVTFCAQAAGKPPLLAGLHFIDPSEQYAAGTVVGALLNC